MVNKDYINPLMDKEFLKQLDYYPHKFLWAKAIALNWEEYPMEEISGKITSGSVNIDGSSAVRRTCSLSIVTEDPNNDKVNNILINDLYWSVHSKFKLMIGVENKINSNYPEIIWFNQGIFIISSFNCTKNTNNYSINLQGKDKMSMLNGDIGGTVPSSWDFGKENITQEDGTILTKDIPIKEIIRQAVHEFAQEEWQNIIVNDLDDYGLELLEYIGDMPLYYIISTSTSGGNDSREIYQIAFDQKIKYVVKKISIANGVYIFPTLTDSEELTDGTLGDLAKENLYDPLLGKLVEDGQTPSAEIALVQLEGDSDHWYTVAQITRDNGYQVCGYRQCDIIYPYDLIASPGETITSVFDKLVQMLGNFEYYYDVDGKFIFQKKKIYLDTSYNNLINEHSINEEVWGENAVVSSKYSYDFDNSTLISSLQNSPNLSNLKNDYSLWGVRKSGDISIPIHMRYAIDHKPEYYRTIDGKVYFTEAAISKYNSLLKNEVAKNAVDWREIIFQMANDYRRHYREDNFRSIIKENNMKNNYDSFYPRGITGYEKYYIDFEMNLSQGVVAYWRELYNKECAGYEVKYLPDGSAETNNIDTISEWQEDIVLNEKYQKNERVIKDGIIYRSLEDENDTEPGTANSKWVKWYGDFSYDNEGWNPNILNNPELLNFWFDFLDTPGQLNKYSVGNIGQRTKATNDDKINAIYFRDVPNVIFTTNGEDPENYSWTKPGYCHFNLPKAVKDTYFKISTRGKNAIDILEEQLYNYTYPASSITLTVIPIYYLIPNTLIYVNDKSTGIFGEYIVEKYSIQFGLNTQMTINAIESPRRLY